MMLPWKQIVLLSITGCLAACTEDVIFQGPRWRTEPSDLILPINSPDHQATITCEAEGSPPPQYRWSLNGTLIDLGNDYRRHMSGGSLIISNLDKDQDTGVYQCTAFNTWGSILSRRASLQFAYLDNFKTQSVRSAVNVREGQGVVLLCGPPPHSGELTFAWIFNEYPHFVQQDSRRFISQETGSLYIAKVERSDVGNYTCVVNNTVTREKILSSPTPLVLRSDGVMGEYEPKIEVHFPDSVPAAKESAVKLECFALGNPVPEISWRRTSGVPFPSKVKMKNSNAVLEIPNFQQEDAGTYECMAENRRGKNAARGRISFHAKPHWLQTMADTALSIEGNLFWECKASGKPKPSYSWLKNGEQVMADSRVQIENGAVSISSLNLSDSGMYQCVAENKHGIIYSSAQLMVLASPPSFSKSPLRALLKARSGSEVTLECKPQASPPAISLWKKGNEILQRTERITLLPDGTLKIANVTKRDAASYTCIAKNQFGTASTTGRLIVTEPTRITMRPTNMEIIVGESIVLPCQIACDPALDVSFSWAFNGQLIDFQRDSDHFERVGGSISGDLMIRNIQLNHGGKYVCVIDTDVESLSTSAILVVKGPPGPPDKVAVEEITDSTAQLSWTPGRDNGSPITGYIIQARTPFTVGWQAVDTVPEVVNGNMLTATVVGLNAWVEYEFRVVARNAVGLGEPSPASAKTRTEDAIPDTAPTDVGGGGGTKSELVITWEPVPEELQNGEGFGYIIAFRPVGTVTWTRAVISTPAARYVFRNDTIPPFSPFDVKVGAYNNRGEGPFSSIATVYSAEEVPSVAPKRVRARSVSAAQIEVSWEALPAIPERVLGYEVMYWEDDTKPDTVGKVRLSGNYTLVNITGLKANTAYYLSVAAFNTAGPGPQSAPINSTTKKPPPDRAPLNIQWTMIGSTLTLHWNPVVAMETESKVTGYLVLLKRHRYNDILTVLTTKTTAELSLSANDNYLIQVKAVSEGGEGVGSEPIHIHKLSMGARGSRASRLSPSCHSAVLIHVALLHLVIFNHSRWSALPPSPSVPSVSLSYVNPPLDWHKARVSVAGLGNTGKDRTAPNS
ncbi:LOW QUALITY PROTEIN: contactin-3 [Archocentrus centrarchus]|uniref:LOW QUALITY PROTEIN: contactin-3 n=1 Tax=Archocentrus centrarchus TaxID=63155 RepID=UPI0011EA13C0|nr:LOW QUALITY PROTEIN: contactin-3-like [Archocentrus centrarchus]